MSSTVRLRRLSQELVRLRKEAGLTVEEVTKRLNWSQGRLTYVEHNKWVKASIRNITALLDLYGIEGDRREGLLELARQAGQKGWWASYRDAFPLNYPGFEEAAATIRTYEAVLVPGLFQTADYATALFKATQVLTDHAAADRVKARCERQKILDRADPPQVCALIDEAALTRPVGGVHVMADQITHLIRLASRPNITIQIVPAEAGAHAAMTGAFVILDFAGVDDAPMVFLEAFTSCLILEKQDDVQAYTLMFQRVMASALTPEETVSRLKELLGFHG